VIELPSSLGERTLGDVLGVLHRHQVSGALRLDELAPSHGRRHAIHWLEGLIYDIETSLPITPLGDRRRERLDALFGLTQARLTFSAMARSRRALAPLAPLEFLHGRPRARDRQQRPAPAAARAPTSARAQAFAVLGLADGATPSDVRAAFKRLARRYHPDLHPGADAETKTSLGREFSRIALAYQALRT
jgi:DnaJ-like protein